MLLGRVLHVRNWWDRVDENVILGALPFAVDVSKLHELGVTGVVNTCEEYAGPVSEYEALGIEQFRMPTIDFTHPKIKDVEAAVDFMERVSQDGGSIYVHCKAGRARSATVVMCWLIKKLQKPAAEIQAILNQVRPHINQRLPERPVIQEFERRHLET